MNILFEINTQSQVPSLTNFHTRVLLVGSFESLKFLISQQRKYSRDISGVYQYYYIVLPNDVPSSKLNNLLKKIMSFCFQNFIVNINVLVEHSNGIIKSYTYFPFDINNCRNDKSVEYNLCKNGNLKWDKPSFPSKLSNFMKCPLRFVLWDEPPFLNLYKNNLVSGIDAHFLETLKELMNVSIIPIISKEGRGNVFSNGTAYGAFKLIQDGFGDLMLGGSICSKDRITHFASTKFYFTMPVILIVRQPKTYSSLEILLFPFDIYTWLTILTLLLGQEICHILLKDTFRRLNGLESFSFKLRIVPWLFGFLILRSSYEGSIFKFLHNRPKRPVPNDFKEAIQSGYKFIADMKLNYFLKDFREFDNILQLYDIPQSMVFEKFQAMNGKVSLISRGESYVGNHLNSSMYQGFLTVKKPIVQNIFCIYMPKFSFLTAELNARIEQMINNGYMKRIVDKSKKFSWKNGKDKKEAHSMNIYHLIGAFQLLGVLICLALCVLVMEIMVARKKM